MMNPTDPLSILKADHDQVKNAFEEYTTMNYSEKKDETKQICQDLAIHMTMEERFFYPEIENISMDAMNEISDARDEHDEVKRYIGEISMVSAEMDLDAQMDMMKGVVLHHIEQEESKIFKMAEDNLKPRFMELAAEMMAFKGKAKGKELVGELMAKVM